MNATLTFFVPGPPTPFTRVLRGERSKRAEKYRAYREVVARTAREAGAEPMDGPVSMSITIFLQKPTKRKFDADNCFKGIADALNTIAYHDDLQVVKGDFTVVAGTSALPEGVSVIVEQVLRGEEAA